MCIRDSIWDFEFCDDGYAPPEPYSQHSRHRLIKLKVLDCVSLFSGGLDSAIGAIDLLAAGRAPLLVSHAYKGDKSCLLYTSLLAEELSNRRELMKKIWEVKYTLCHLQASNR